MTPRGIAAALALTLLATPLSGCAMTVNGRTQPVTFETDPPGAFITVLPEDIELVSPGEVELARGIPHTVLIRRDDFDMEIRHIEREVWDYAGILGFLYGLVFPVGIPVLIADVESGATFVLHPDHLSVPLTPASASSTDGARPCSWSRPVRAPRVDRIRSRGATTTCRTDAER